MTRKTLSLLITLACGGSIFVAIAYNGAQMAAKSSQTVATQQPSYPDVAAIEVSPQHYQASVRGYGEAMPKHSLQLVAQVQGQVLSLSQNFASGNRVKQGEVLAVIEDSDYRQAVATAEKKVADAQLALLEEQRQGEQAQLEWHSSGLAGEPDSPLVLRQPQLDAAKANLKQAQAELESARLELSHTRIRAPFDAVIVSRAIEPGGFVQTGTEVVSLYSTDTMEVRIPLSAKQWRNLPDHASQLQWPVTLHSGDNNRQWRGYVARVEQHFDSDDRQRALIVAVDRPLEQAPPLYAGTFVSADISGRQLDSVWRVPASAISQSGELWLVSDERTLTRHTAQKVFEQGEWSYLAPVTEQQVKVVVRPLNSYVAGMRITPIEEASL